ncbi:hypothetical protein NUW54_g6026 [Trametes sanguinea]|uniref:Uncharacterized protein n=1 Tax=Trametes sanguinea TaxID=158606 RepID=A0ACC1PTG7_9APHY|nr:hypothetical protein NUW54_g6026 [Trametes sanguinea]
MADTSLFWNRSGEAHELPTFPSSLEDWNVGQPLDDHRQMILARVEAALSLRIKRMWLRSQNNSLILEIEYENNERDIVRTPNPEVVDDKDEAALTVPREAKLLRWLKSRDAALPVPSVRAIIEPDDAFAYSIVVMEKMPGTMVVDAVGNASDEAKAQLMRSYAEFEVQLFRIEVPQRIGEARCEDLTISVDCTEGSPSSLEEHFNAILELKERSLEDIEEAPVRESGTRILARLKSQLPDLYARLASPSRRRCVLKHDDLSPQNILMNSEGKITGVIDWDMQVVLPAALAVSYPSFIRYDGKYHPEYAREPYPGVEIWWFVSPGDSLRLRELYTQIARELDEEYYDALVNGEVLRQVADWLGGSPDYVLMERWMETAFPSA